MVYISFTIIISQQFTGNARCGPDEPHVTLKDDYFTITTTNLEFYGKQYEGDSNRNVSFRIRGRVKELLSPDLFGIVLFPGPGRYIVTKMITIMGIPITGPYPLVAC